MTNSIRCTLLLAWTVCLSTPALLSAQDYEWAYKMFEERDHDFGTVARGAEVSYRFQFKNLYKETLHISNVRTTCGCSIAQDPPKTTFQSLESGYVEVKLDTRKHKHEKKSNLVVTFDRPFYAEVKLPLKAYIRSDVVFTPGAAEFGTIDLGAGKEQTVEVAYAGRSDWEIKDVKTGSEFIKAEVKEVSRGNGSANYVVNVTIAPEAPAGVIREQIMLVTNDTTPYVPLLVQGRVESDITVATPDVKLGLVTSGQDKPFSVVIRGKEPFEIEKVECETELGCFKVRLPKSARTTHIIPLTFTAPEDRGTVKETFTVTIAGRKDPVQFTASADVVTSVGRPSF